MSSSRVYLIPSLLDENGLATIPACIPEAVDRCQVFFVENERTARRYLKKIKKDIVIDEYEWFLMGEDQATVFGQKIREGKIIGLLSEAGCPGVADPGQSLIALAHEWNIEVCPLAGPSSVLLALMASGMNGQQFRFVGYLPVKDNERTISIKELETESRKKNCTQIFIETPYRNNQLVEALLKTCQPSTRLCLAANLTGKTEWIKTRSIAQWKKEKPDLHKQPAIFCLQA